MSSLPAGAPPRSVYDVTVLALVLIGPRTDGSAGQPDEACRHGEPDHLLERMHAGGFDVAARDESLMPLLAAHPGAAPAPRHLAALGLRCAEDAAGLQQRLGGAARRDATAIGVADAGTLGRRPVWTLWTRLAATGPSSGEAPWLYVVVMSPPEFAGEAGISEFGRYYADHHLGEVVEETGYLRASLFAAASPPDDSWRHGPGRYLAVYEAAGRQPLQRQAARVQAMASMSFDGAPPAWASRRVAWRAAFRPMAVPAAAAPAVPGGLDSQASDE